MSIKAGDFVQYVGNRFDFCFNADTMDFDMPKTLYDKRKLYKVEKDKWGRAEFLTLNNESIHAAFFTSSNVEGRPQFKKSSIQIAL